MAGDEEDEDSLVCSGMIWKRATRHAGSMKTRRNRRLLRCWLTRMTKATFFVFLRHILIQARNQLPQKPSLPLHLNLVVTVVRILNAVCVGNAATLIRRLLAGFQNPPVSLEQPTVPVKGS